MAFVEMNVVNAAGKTDTSIVGLSSMTLQKAVRDGRHDLVPLLLNRISRGNSRKKLNERDADGFAAIHYAARFNRLVILDQLLAAQPDTNVKTKDGFTALHFAARHLPRSADAEEKEGRSDARSSSRLIVRSLLQAHINYSCKPTNVAARTSHGITPLHMACSRGNLPAVEELIEFDKTCVNETDKYAYTPLHEACFQGNTKIVQVLLDRGADVTACSRPDFETPLHVACKEGHIDVIKELLKPGHGEASLVSARDHRGNTPLHLAVESGVFEAVKVLLVLNADPDAADTHGIHPVHLAAAQGHTSIAELLLKYKEEVKNALDGELRTPLHHAAMHDQTEMIKFLMQKGADKEASDEDSATPLVLAAAWGKAHAVNALIEGGAEVNTTDKDGKSAVYWAAQEGHVEVLKVLLVHEEGAQLFFVTELYHQNTPLHVAAWRGHTKAFKAMIQLMEEYTQGKYTPSQEAEHHNGDTSTAVKVDVRNEEEKTPLHLAAQRGHLDIVKFLVRTHFPLIFAEDEDGNTPLHLAATFGQVEVTNFLIDAGAVVDARNSKLWTPLDCAAHTGCVGVITELIEAEAPLNPKDKSSLTPLILACRGGHLTAVQVLLENGADVTIREAETGYNCLDMAVQSGHKDVAMAIVNSGSWKEALRNGVGKETPMRRMIRQLPEVALAVLDRCFTDNATEENPDIVNSKNYEVTLDFEFLEDWRPKVSRGFKGRLSRLTRRGIVYDESYSSTANLYTNSSNAVSSVDISSHAASENEEENQSTRWKVEGFSKNRHPLSLMVKYGRGDLLRHPVVSALLDRKWKRYGRLSFALNLLSYLLFLLFLTLYALLLPHPDHVYCRSYSIVGSVSSLPLPNQTCPWDNLTVAVGDPTVPMTFAASIVLYISAGIVIFLGGLRLILEVFQVLKKNIIYFFEVENYIEDATYILAIVFVIQFGMNCWCPTSWQWQMGAVAVFLAWINLILFLKRVPLLGIYVLMYTNIVYTFLRVVIIAFLFVVAFSLTFYMILFKAILGTGAINKSTFRTPGLSIIKTMVMTTGEFEYDTIFGNTNDDDNQLTEFSGLAYFLWIIFLIMMPVLLVNLLVGLAVDDTKAIQDHADLKRIGMQVNLTMEAEALWTLLPRTLRPDLTLKFHTFRPNRRLNPWELFKDAWGVERWDSVDNIHKYRKSEASVSEDARSQTDQLASEVKQLKAEMTEQNVKIERLLKQIALKQGIDVHEDTHDDSNESISHI